MANAFPSIEYVVLLRFVVVPSIVIWNVAPIVPPDWEWLLIFSVLHELLALADNNVPLELKYAVSPPPDLYVIAAYALTLKGKLVHSEKTFCYYSSLYNPIMALPFAVTDNTSPFFSGNKSVAPHHCVSYVFTVTLLTLTVIVADAAPIYSEIMYCPSPLCIVFVIVVFHASPFHKSSLRAVVRKDKTFC